MSLLGGGVFAGVVGGGGVAKWEAWIAVVGEA